jgi:hypothetical protein
MGWVPRRRRRSIVTLALATLVVVALGIGGGAARSTADATAAAKQLDASSRYASAIAVDDAIATRTGPMYVLARGGVQSASLDAEETVLAWAEQLDRSGHVDEAVALAGTVTDPRLAARSDQVRASLLLEAAKDDASRGDFGSALQRLDELAALGLAASSAQVAQLTPQYEVDEAARLTAAGRAPDAIALLDAASAAGASGRALANAALAATLLAAGQAEAADASYREAVATLKRLVSTFPSSAPADRARGMLGAPQPVTGTLVDKQGKAISADVRLSSHFESEPGGYLTSGPFYYSSADRNGDFRFASIPQGGPYVLEIYANGNWMTFVDPSTGQPANPVNVTPLVPVDLTIVELPS